jgi:hypothetical protein
LLSNLILIFSLRRYNAVKRQAVEVRRLTEALAAAEAAADDAVAVAVTLRQERAHERAQLMAEVEVEMGKVAASRREADGHAEAGRYKLKPVEARVDSD